MADGGAAAHAGRVEGDGAGGEASGAQPPNPSTPGEAFILLLNEGEAEEELLRRTSICLTPTRLTSLSRICESLQLRLTGGAHEQPAVPIAAIARRGSQLESPRGDDEDDDDDDNNNNNGGGGASRREAQDDSDAERQSRGKKRSRSPVQPFLNITELYCPESISEHMRVRGLDARSFLAMGSDLGKRLPPDIGSSRPQRPGPHFLTVYYYTLALKDRIDADNVIWLFTMLFYFDLVQHICPGTTGKVGRLMMEDIDAFLQDVPDAIVNREILKIKLNSWSLLGKKLNHLCVEFNEGCLFYLGKILTPHFLENRLTMKGKHWTRAKRHLNLLDIKGKANRSRLTQLGRDTRKLLIGEFTGLDDA